MEAKHLVPLVALLLVWGASCFRQAATPPSASPPPDAAIPAEATRVVQLAKEHLAKERDSDPARLQVVKVEKVDWPDTSLGCPQPGMMYAQVITPGYRVILSDGTKEYEYHTDAKDWVVPCPPAK